METALKQFNSLSQQHNDETSADLQSCILFFTDIRAEERSQTIDRALEECAKLRNNLIKVLPLGAFSMMDIVNQLKNNNFI